MEIHYNYDEIERIKKEILDELNDFQEHSVKEVIHKKINNMVTLSSEEKKQLFLKLQNAIFGYDILQPLLDQPDVTEIMVNGLDYIFIEVGGKIQKTKIQYENKNQLMQLIHKICAEVGREINLGSPTLDARLKDGSRVNIVLEPVALNGPIITIRKFKRALSSNEDLLKSGMFPIAVSELFKCLVKSRYNLFICGSTGSGKTTLLSCLSSLIEKDSRIITIEDAAEISLSHHENVITLETRKSHQSTNAIDMSHLIKNALRMRPDRIVVGEVRGDEVIDMLQAMNTGHEGSLSTGHSNSPIDMLTRLEVIASSFSDINHLLIRKQIISAIDFLIYVEKLPSGERKVTQISEVIKNTPDFTLNPIYTLEVSHSTHGPDPQEDFNFLLAKITSNSKIRRYYDCIS